MERGFTLVENLIAVAIFVLLAGAIYQISALLISIAGTYRENTTISSLASEYMEIIHNLPYSKVGAINGAPNGTLPDISSPTLREVNGKNYQIYYLVTFIDDPADGTAEIGTDSTPDDYKQVKLRIKNTATSKIYCFLTSIAPTKN